MRFIQNMALARKFALLGALALALILPLVILGVQEQWTLRNAAAAERDAIPAVGTLLKLIRETQVHRGMTASALGGNVQATAARPQQADKVDAALVKALQAMHDQVGPDPKRRADALRSHWLSLRDELKNQKVDASDSFARHNTIVREQLRLVADVADASGLLLDPESSTYHLVVLVTERLPMLTELLGQSRAQGAAAIAKGSVSPSQRNLLEGNVAQITQLEATLERHYDQLLSEPANAAKLTMARTQAAEAAQQAVTLLRKQVLSPDRPEGESSTFFANLTSRIDLQFKLADASFDRLVEALTTRVSAYERKMMIEMALIVLGLGCGIVVSTAIVRGAKHSTQVAQHALAALARGELDHRLADTTRDETGQIARQVGDSMRELARLVSDIKQAGGAVGTASVQIASGNADLASRTEESAASIERAASSLEQINATVHQNAQNALQAADLANQASTLASNGGELIGRLVATMEQISQRSQQIADITSVIDGIAFQTNILALNAAVEAARAGDSGRGFAVVASEVRALAQRSAAAAREIKTLIGQSAETVDAGAQLVGDTREAMVDIVSQASQVDAMVREIGRATSEQATGISHISSAVNALEHSTQQNAALVEESAAAAESLRLQAEGLVKLVGRFRTGAPA